jgi:hypothetical protein
MMLPSHIRHARLHQIDPIRPFHESNDPFNWFSVWPYKCLNHRVITTTTCIDRNQVFRVIMARKRSDILEVRTWCRGTYQANNPNEASVVNPWPLILSFLTSWGWILTRPDQAWQRGTGSIKSRTNARYKFLLNVLHCRESCRQSTSLQGLLWMMYKRKRNPPVIPFRSWNQK